MIDRQNCFILYSRAPKTSSYLFFPSQNSDAARMRLVATPGDSNTCLACSCGRRGGGFLLVGTSLQELTEVVARAAECGFLLCGEFSDGTSRRPGVACTTFAWTTVYVDFPATISENIGRTIMTGVEC